MKKNCQSKPSVRDRVIDFLLFLASEDCLNASKQNHMPWEKIAYELARIWFDEIYAPGITYLEGIKGDFSDEQAAHFQSFFSDEEMHSLERFHRFFELRIEMLPDYARKSHIFPDNHTWRNIMRHARYLSEELEPDPVKREVRLKKYIRKRVTAQRPSLGAQTRPGAETAAQ